MSEAQYQKAAAQFGWSNPDFLPLITAIQSNNSENIQNARLAISNNPKHPEKASQPTTPVSVDLTDARSTHNSIDRPTTPLVIDTLPPLTAESESIAKSFTEIFSKMSLGTDAISSSDECDSDSDSSDEDLGSLAARLQQDADDGEQEEVVFEDGDSRVCSADEFEETESCGDSASSATDSISSQCPSSANSESDSEEDGESEDATPIRLTESPRNISDSKATTTTTPTPSESFVFSSLRRLVVPEDDRAEDSASVSTNYSSISTDSDSEDSESSDLDAGPLASLINYNDDNNDDDDDDDDDEEEEDDDDVIFTAIEDSGDDAPSALNDNTTDQNEILWDSDDDANLALTLPPSRFAHLLTLTPDTTHTLDLDTESEPEPEPEPTFHSRRLSRSSLTSLATAEYRRLNSLAFASLLPSVPLHWDSRLTATAALTHCTRSQDRAARITLSLPVLTTKRRLTATLLHEMCHVAAWLIDAEGKPPHGKTWKKWARRAEAAMRDAGEVVPVKVKHDYEMVYKYEWKCTGECKKTIGRQRLTIREEQHVCGGCKGELKRIK